MESFIDTPVKCLIDIETSIFFLPNFENYQFMTYNNFPQYFHRKSFKVISKSRFHVKFFGDVYIKCKKMLL